MPGIHLTNRLQKRLVIRGFPQRFQVLRVLGQAADTGQEFDVLSLPPRWGEKNEEEIHRVRFRWAELDGVVGGRHQEEGRRQARDGGMGYGDPVSQTGGVGFLPGRQSPDRFGP